MSIDTAGLGFVRDLVRRDAAIVLDQDKGYLVESRLLPLARQAGMDDVGRYVRELRNRMTPEARKDVVEALTTNETSFFRDVHPFRVLREHVLPELAANRPGGRVSVWSAACSSGQEAYSIAMTADSDPSLSSLRLEILGTDLSHRMVRRAQDGLYTQLEVNRGLPAANLVKYFKRDGSGWRVTPRLKTGVQFSEQNLINPFPPMPKFDVVFLRNVLIYFDVPTRANILRRVAQVMHPDGYLFLGSAETTNGVDVGWERQTAHNISLYRPRKDHVR